MSLTVANITKIERRVLAFLDDAPNDRITVVVQLSSPESRIGSGVFNGSNAGIPLIMGKWCSRLIKAGYVIQVQTPAGFYRHHAITASGRQFLQKVLG